jgi:hypothetical protein
MCHLLLHEIGNTYYPAMLTVIFDKKPHVTMKCTKQVTSLLWGEGRKHLRQYFHCIVTYAGG